MKPQRNNTYNSARAQAVIARILELTTKRPRTQQELSKALGYADSTVRGYLLHMRAEKLIHIGERVRYETKHRPVRARYAAGEGPDAPPLEPESNTTKIRRYRERAQRFPDRLPGYARSKQRTTERKQKLYKLAAASRVTDPLARAALLNGMADPKHFIRSVTPEVRHDILTMRQAGATYKDIALRVGVAYDTVRWHVKNYGNSID